TIIDPNEAGRGFSFHSGEDANSILDGLTITNSYKNYGGGIYCYDSNPMVTNCTITGNSADYGGGIACVLSNPRLTNCIISGNSTYERGGAIACSESSPTIINCTISGNEASNSGGGIDCYRNSSPTINNCILWGNSATDGDEIALRSETYPSGITVSYSDVKGGHTEVYVESGCALNWEEGNIDADPCFASFDHHWAPTLWDFHLQSAYGRWEPNDQLWVVDSNTSACIDAGDPNSDWNGELWPNGKRINMGAFGGTTGASMYGNIADFDVSSKVDCNDLAEITTRWLTEQDCIMDLKSDGRIDFADFALFADNWLWQKQ
ncbi:right-handed parallel beta-helix repeat-containing protein, partial [Planctomycetota bacterium]